MARRDGRRQVRQGPEAQDWKGKRKLLQVFSVQFINEGMHFKRTQGREAISWQNLWKCLPQ